MSATSKILVMAGEKFACIRIVGRGDFTNSVEFTTLARELRQSGCHHFVIDLSECTLLDSTFLGLLAGLGLRTAEKQARGEDAGLELLNANPRIVELLECLGVLQLFNLKQGQIAPPERLENLTQTPVKPTKQEVTRTCLEAHKTLMGLNPENVMRFKDVAQFLAEDLKKQTIPEKAQSPS